jgi:hypothetical protein
MSKLFDKPPVIAGEHMNTLLYGPAGSGKTTAGVGTSLGPVIVFNLDGPNALHYARKIAAERGTELLEIQVAADEDPRERLREAIVYAQANEVGTFVIDGVGKLRDQIAFAIGGDDPSLPQWGMISKALRDIVRTLRDAPMSTVWIAHEQVVEEGEAVIVRPEIDSKGRAAQMLMGEVDVVGYCQAWTDDAGERHYSAQLVERRGRRAKDRSGELGEVRELDLTEWLSVFQKALATDLSDIPFLDSGERTNGTNGTNETEEQADEG